MAALGEFDARRRGVAWRNAASSTHSFMRELGMTVGIVVFWLGTAKFKETA